MGEYQSVRYGECNSRGEGGDGCGAFHEFVCGPDNFCASCRPAPDHPVIIAAEKWMNQQKMSKPVYGSKDWYDGLMAWSNAGRPGNPESVH